jgi:hypothetical protein
LFLVGGALGMEELERVGVRIYLLGSFGIRS